MRIISGEAIIQLKRINHEPVIILIHSCNSSKYLKQVKVKKLIMQEIQILKLHHFT